MALEGIVNIASMSENRSDDSVLMTVVMAMVVVIAWHGKHGLQATERQNPKLIFILSRAVSVYVAVIS